MYLRNASAADDHSLEAGAVVLLDAPVVSKSSKVAL
jgi:hypothetical protein